MAGHAITSDRQFDLDINKQFQLQQKSEDEYLVAVLERQCHVEIQPRGSKDSSTMWPFGRSLDDACHVVAFPKEEPDDCCYYDFDEDKHTAPVVCGHHYVPLSHSRTRLYENRTKTPRQEATEGERLETLGYGTESRGYESRLSLWQLSING